VKKVGVPFKREDWVALGTTRMEACVPTAGRSRPRDAGAGLRVLDRRRSEIGGARAEGGGMRRLRGSTSGGGRSRIGVGAPAGVGGAAAWAEVGVG
jgi:hypothetical protein